MYRVRCTQTLLGRLGVHAPVGAAEDAVTTTLLGDWFARTYNRGRHRLLLCTSSASLLTVLVPAKDLPAMPLRLAAAVHELLFALGAPLAQINDEISAMDRAIFSATNSRSIQGSMTDMTYLADGYLAGHPIPEFLLVTELKMSEAPCGPLKYRAPRDVALELLRSAS